jgi:hypothetical protein
LCGRRRGSGGFDCYGRLDRRRRGCLRSRCHSGWSRRYGCCHWHNRCWRRCLCSRLHRGGLLGRPANPKSLTSIGGQQITKDDDRQEACPHGSQERTTVRTVDDHAGNDDAGSDQSQVPGPGAQFERPVGKGELPRAVQGKCCLPGSGRAGINRTGR